MDALHYVGGFVAFYPTPSEVVKCLPVRGARQFCGQVMDSKPSVAEPGVIPSATLLVRGQSGKQMQICLVNNFARVFPTWEEALKSAGL